MKNATLLLALASVGIAGVVAAHAATRDAAARATVTRLALPGERCLAPGQRGTVVEAKTMHAANPVTGGHDVILTIMLDDGRAIACVRAKTPYHAGQTLMGTGLASGWEPSRR